MSAPTETNSAPVRPASVAAGPAAEPEQPNRWLRGHVPGEPGIWIFILGDMTLYAWLFGSFIATRARHVSVFNHSAGTLTLAYGAINTMLLLTSSYAVVLAVRSLRERIAVHRAPQLTGIAFVCGIGFIVNKVLEYSSLINAGHVPDRNQFYEYFYILTGIHLTHLLAGMVLLVYLYKKSRKQNWEASDITGVESAASFWHVVDLLWIVLFSLFYLVR